jgi:hypothetical protein
MKKLIIGLFATASSITMFAQDENDALRYSNTQYQGTARSLGIGNAMGSLGADFSSLSINPAGIGLFRKGEVSFTPSFSVINNKSSYLGNINEVGDNKLNIAQAGIVLTHAKQGNLYRKSGWKAASFAFGINRVATFKNEYSYEGKNNQSSFVERYAEEFNRAGGLNNNTLNSVSFPAYAAWSTYLIDQDYAGDSTKAKSYVPYEDGLQQRKQVSESGGMHEFVISGGGNYMEKLMLGATLGITRSNYIRTTVLSETDLSGNTSNDFQYARFTEQLNTEGTGINLKLGAIFKPVNAFRIGLAVHTPTRIYFNDMYSIGMETNTDSLKIRNNPGADPVTKYTQDTLQVFNYSMNTPYKAIASATVMFNKYGFITADLEYLDYKSMKYDYGIGYENESNAVNTAIRNKYRDAINIRIGAEAKLGDFALRGGVAMYGSPYTTNPNAMRTNISGGLGYRAKSWYIDIAFIRSMQESKELPYVLARTNANVQTATINNSVSQLVFTLGRRF